MKTINEQVSKELQLAPLGEDQVVEYRLIHVGEIVRNREDRDTGEKRVAQKPTYRISGKASIYDPIAKKEILIQNIVSEETYEDANGEMRTKPIVESVVFNNGIKRVKANQFNSYCFMERLNLNIDNPFRKPGSRALFFKVNAEKDLTKQFQHRSLKLDAEVIVRDSDLGLARSIAEAIAEKDSGFKFDMNDIMQLKTELWRACETMPKNIVLASNSKKMKLKVIIMDLEKFNHIKSQVSRDEIIWMYTDVFGGSIIAKLNDPSDKYNALVSALLNNSIPDASKRLKELVEAHQKITTGIMKSEKV